MDPIHELHRAVRARSHGPMPDYVPVAWSIDMRWFRTEHALRSVGAHKFFSYRFGPLERVNALSPGALAQDIELPGTTVFHQHVSCAGIEIPGAENSILCVHYSRAGKSYISAVPGVSIAPAAPGSSRLQQ